jgi:hypothetical protein
MKGAVRRAMAKLGKPTETPTMTMTKEQATAKLAALQRDAEFRTRLFEGSASARAEWGDLIRTAAGHALPTGNSTSIAQARLAALKNDPSWRTRYLAGDAQARDELRELHGAIAGAEDDDQ